MVALELALELALRRYGLTSAGPMTHVEVAETAEVAARGKRRPKPAALAVTWSGTPVRLRRREQREVAEAVGFAGGRLRLEGTNIQLTREAEARSPRPQLLDFGAWRARA